MATYKKRGYKPKTKKEKVEAFEDNSATAEVFNTLDEGASKTEAWIEKNQKIIFGIVGVVAVAVVGYILYNNFYKEPQQVEATNEMYHAQSFYERALTATEDKDSLYGLSLNGYGGKYGFIDIADKYSGTDAGNQANYYAGMAYLNMNEYQNAISYLDKYKGGDAMTGALAKGAIGDAFNQLDQAEEALKYYQDAAGMNPNNVTTPRFLLKAGITALKLGNTDAALKHFSEITEKYDASPEAEQAKIYKGQAEAMK